MLKLGLKQNNTKEHYWDGVVGHGDIMIDEIRCKKYMDAWLMKLG